MASSDAASPDAMREIIEVGLRELTATVKELFGNGDPLSDPALLRRVLTAANGDTAVALHMIFEDTSAAPEYHSVHVEAVQVTWDAGDKDEDITVASLVGTAEGQAALARCLHKASGTSAVRSVAPVRQVAEGPYDAPLAYVPPASVPPASVPPASVPPASIPPASVPPSSARGGTSGPLLQEVINLVSPEPPVRCRKAAVEAKAAESTVKMETRAEAEAKAREAARAARAAARAEAIGEAKRVADIQAAKAKAAAEAKAVAEAKAKAEAKVVAEAKAALEAKRAAETKKVVEVRAAAEAKAAAGTKAAAEVKAALESKCAASRAAESRAAEEKRVANAKAAEQAKAAAQQANRAAQAKAAAHDANRAADFPPQTRNGLGWELCARLAKWLVKKLAAVPTQLSAASSGILPLCSPSSSCD